MAFTMKQCGIIVEGAGAAKATSVKESQSDLQRMKGKSRLAQVRMPYEIKKWFQKCVHLKMRWAMTSIEYL